MRRLAKRIEFRAPSMAEALLGTQMAHSGLARSLFYRWFTDSEERSRYPVEDHELHSRQYAALLRGAQSRHPGDPDAPRAHRRPPPT
jgi:MmyB-like transcription regulator ligand binding domain